MGLALVARTRCQVIAWDSSHDALTQFHTRLASLELASSAGEVAHRADVVLLTVPDDQIDPTVERLAALGGRWSSRMVAHFSGRCGTEVLEPLQQLGADVVAFHPAMAFAGDVVEDVKRLARVRVAVTAPTRDAEQAGEALVHALGAQPFIVKNADRVLYHVALTHATNHLVTIIVQAGELLDTLSIPTGADILRPAVEAALSNALTKGPAGATGPVVRGDDGTIREHMATIERRYPDLLDCYVAMTMEGIRIAERTGRINAEQALRLRAALARR